MTVQPVAPAPPGSAHGLPRPQLDRGRGRTVLIAALAIVGVLAAVGVALMAVLSAGAWGAVIALALAAVPAPLIVAAYLLLDRYEPEPRRFVVAALLWGGAVSTALVLLVQEVLKATTDVAFAVNVAVAAPVAEELTKGMLLVLVLLRRRAVAGILDGIIYAGLVGVGFAFTENVLYYSGAYAGALIPEFDGAYAATNVFALRGLATPFAHPLFTTATGVGIVVALTAHRRWLRILAPLVGYCVAVGLHAAWNGSTLLWQGLGFPIVYAGFMVPLFGVAAFLAARALTRQGEVVRRALGEAAGRGWLHPAEIHWLVRFGDRAAARRFARTVAGKEAGRALRAYQGAATEMALMHDRVLRHRAPDDGTQRVHAHLRRMQSWRPYLVMPPQEWSAPGSAPALSWGRPSGPQPVNGSGQGLPSGAGTVSAAHAAPPSHPSSTSGRGY